MKTKITVLFPILFYALVSNAQPPLVPSNERPEVIRLVESISDWALKAEVASGELKIQAKRRTSIFINSNLARVLIAAHEITGNQDYLNEALDWFDRLVDLQQPTTTMNGLPAGWWGDFSPAGNIYLGDAGTSATALAGAVRFAEPQRQKRYMKALELYANFVRFGTKDDPQNKNRGGCDGWIIESGPDKGAVGCGYYRNELSEYPYTISTAVTGAAFFSALYELTGNIDYITIANNATRWLLKIRQPNGEFPYILHNFTLDQWPLDTMSYVTDGIVGVHMRTPDASLKLDIERSVIFSLQWLFNMQNKSGTWGKLRSEDQQRSQGLINLFVWYYHDKSADTRVRETVQENYRYFLNPKNAAAFGVNELPITTGFVGIGIAEVLEPGITYRIK